MKKSIFKTSYLCYTALLAVIVIILLFSVYRILSNFEKSQAKYMVEDYLETIRDAVDNNDGSALKEIGIDASTVRFTTTDELCSAFLTACNGKQLDYELSPKSFDVNNPIYNILCENTPVAQIQLTLVSETVRLGFLSIPEWKLASFSPSADALGKAYTLSIPDGFTIAANGIALTKDDVVSEENGIFAYYAEGFVTDPVFEIKDAFGTAVQTGSAELLTSDIYSVPVNYERFDLALPADFTCALSKGVLSSVANTDRTIYSIYTAKPVDLDFINNNLTASDSIGNPLTFRESDGKILPVFSEYIITAADCYRIFADDVQLDIASAELTPLTNPQYSDETVSLATYKVGLAKEVDFQVLDAQNALVAFETSSNRIDVPLFDCVVTIPVNFALSVNGRPAEVEPRGKDNPDYKYIAEYLEVPTLLEYRFEGLAKAPTFTVTDNQLLPTNYLLTEGGELTITEQKGADTLPDWLSAQVDPLDIAKKWSLFMTNDLDGSLNGYYNMRNYLIRGSYYDTVAYQWATNIDITFISDHIFRDPPFSKEAISNVVVFGDNCFSCDIYFEKHMTLIRTGKFQDDIFHRRMYFIFTDDTDDGIENPHWVIADMQEIQ